MDILFVKLLFSKFGTILIKLKCSKEEYKSILDINTNVSFWDKSISDLIVNYL